VAGLPLENLTAVPGQEVRRRRPLGTLGLADLATVVPQQRFVKPRRPVGLVRVEQQPALVEGEGPVVEQLVVQHAQRQPVLLLVGAGGLVADGAGQLLINQKAGAAGGIEGAAARPGDFGVGPAGDDDGAIAVEQVVRSPFFRGGAR
jgi:hypothetical protein